MWNRVEKILASFKDQFTRTAAFKWFVVVVIGLMVRTDKLGITSVIRALSIAPKNYESMLHFFRAESWSLPELRDCWCKTVEQNIPLFCSKGRALLVGDGTKQPKEGRYMPGVKKLAQESETQSKPEYIHGHMWGGVGVLVGNARRFFCVPLSMRIHDGLQSLTEWGENVTVSHVVQMMRDGSSAAQSLKRDALFLLDRYFLSVPALLELIRLNAENAQKVEIITKLKRSVVAYEPALQRLPGQRGRTRKKGAKVKLVELFNTQKEQFRSQKLNLYGKKHLIRYYSVDLLWGQGLYQKLRFVLVEYDSVQSILASTDLTVAPLDIVRLYSYRFRIEHTFRELKQDLGGFSYHFWTKALPKLSHFKKKSDPDPIAQVTDSKKRHRIRQVIRATELYALLACVAMGILQALSIDYSNGVFSEQLRYQRTPAKRNPSEANMMVCLRQRIFSLLAFHAQNEIPRLIFLAQSTIGDGSRGVAA